MHFKSDCIDNDAYYEYVNMYSTRHHVIFVALDEDLIVGFINERGNGHISMVFVDGMYHRKGIATAMMEQMVFALKSQEYEKNTPFVILRSAVLSVFRFCGNRL